MVSVVGGHNLWSCDGERATRESLERQAMTRQALSGGRFNRAPKVPAHQHSPLRAQGLSKDAASTRSFYNNTFKMVRITFLGLPSMTMLIRLSSTVS
jgi:hypothetical protein